MAKFDIKDIRGVIAATLTFFDENEKVDEARTRKMCDFLIDAGINGLYLTGSTGAAFTMTNEERNFVVDTVIDQVAGRVPVIVHVGDIGTKKSIALAEYAERAGADAISSVPPFYWKFGKDEIYNYYKDVSSSVSIPTIVYNVSLAGEMGRDLIMRLVDIPNVKGLKYTMRSHDEMGSIKRELGPDFMIYSGVDEMEFSGISSGADGVIGSYYNVIPELAIKIYNAAKAGDAKLGMHLQGIATEFIFAAIRSGHIPAIHELLRWRGLDAGYVRRPFLTPAAERFDALKEDLRRIKKEFDTKELDIFNI